MENQLNRRKEIIFMNNTTMKSGHMEDKKESSSTTTENPTLSLSESFYSVQCEGVSTGVPAYFIRLKGCNLICGGKNGSLMKEGKATWWCDTEAVWRKGKKTDIQVLIDDWKEEGILNWVLNGRVHLVWTGGEPTLTKHQKNIVECIDYLNESLSRYVSLR
jgi:organic radical activating enzyme